MATYKKFEDQPVWQKSRMFSNNIYYITKKNDFSRDFALVRQIRDSAVSIMSNIAEGFDRDGNNEHAQFLSISKASSSETKSQLYVALDQGYITKEEFDLNYKLANEISSMLAGYIKYLKKSAIKGIKYKKS